MMNEQILQMQSYLIWFAYNAAIVKHEIKDRIELDSESNHVMRLKSCLKRNKAMVLHRGGNRVRVASRSRSRSRPNVVLPVPPSPVRRKYTL